jgi:uncharacterized phage infection (PIP) family protein YhgE
MAEDYLKNLGATNSHLDAYERELADLEWKHNELSKSYKQLVSKNSKTNKKFRLETERVKILESDKAKLMSKLEEVSDIHKDLKNNYELETKKVKVLEEG